VTNEPHFNIRAVERLTGVPAPTLRSWERRYGFPVPQRTLTARRLYSQDQVRTIRWVREQTERGLSAAQAIEWAQHGGQPATADGRTAVPSPEALIRAQIEATRRYDEQAVDAGLTTAFAHYPADRVLLEVITPALVEVGELWAQGEIPVAAEHFYSNIIRRRLLGLLAAQPAITPRMTAALACLPGEQHELGLLMLALFLRWAGVRVFYLGADLPIADIIRLARTDSVDTICLSAGAAADWTSLQELTAHLPDGDAAPRVYLGGAAAGTFDAPAGVRVLTAPLPEATEMIVGRE
jgi:DNA-binding transcriptional MerR regulator/methylmalonyl-CoA mutase cobalamin-binding subunit